MTNEEFREIAKQIPPSHPNTELSFRLDCIRNHFLIYDGKRNKCVCTTCGYEFDIAPGEYSHMHGLRDVCPCCERDSVCLSAGRGRGKYEERHRLLTFASDGKSLWMVMNDILVRFEEFGAAQLHRSMVEVFRINADEQKHWRFTGEGWFYPAHWAELKTFNPAPLPSAPYYQSKYDMHVFIEGIKEIIANSDCRYLAGEDLVEKLQWADVTRWISLQMKYPALELLRKGGFRTLASYRLQGENYQNAINIRAGTIEKALRLPRKWVRALRRNGIGDRIRPKELKAFHRADDKVKQAAVDNWEAFSQLVNSFRYDEYDQLISGHTTIDKYLYYMGGQKHSDPTWYCDYLENAYLLGWDLKRKKILFPPDIIAAHDEAAALRDIEKNAEIDRRIRKHAINVDYKLHNLMALCALSQGELNSESRFLHHCVRTYGNRIAEGRTLIYFVRKTDEPNTPFYTLEISPRNGTVIQCRGDHNCSMTEEVREFKDGFEKEFRKIISKRGDTLCRAKA